jgi:hypothetical protein
MALISTLLCMVIMVLLAIYWTLWKIRTDLHACQDKLTSERSETQKSPEEEGL